MKKVWMVAVILGFLCVVLAVISRLTMKPLAVAPGGITASVLFDIANTCFLVALTFVILDHKSKK